MTVRYTSVVEWHDPINLPQGGLDVMLITYLPGTAVRPTFNKQAFVYDDESDCFIGRVKYEETYLFDEESGKYLEESSTRAVVAWAYWPTTTKQEG